MKVGPDGAIYVVDWYNPITCHQDDAYRDPTRDKAHGRIWRLSSVVKTVTPIDLLTADIADVLDELKSTEHWARYQAKRALTVRDAEEVAIAINAWVKTLDTKDPGYEHQIYEALAAYATIEHVQPNLLERLLRARDHRARAYAARMVGRWHDRLKDPLQLLAPRVVDEHPLVRLEAVIACAAIPSARSMQVAARIVDEPMDEWTKYALKQSVHHLHPHWLPAFERGEMSFLKPKHLAAVLNESGGSEVVSQLKRLVATDDIALPVRATAIASIIAAGGPEDWQTYGLEKTPFLIDADYDSHAHAAALARVVEAARYHDDGPSESVGVLLEPLVGSSNSSVQTSALMLIGMWSVNEMRDKVLAIAKDDGSPIVVRAAAFNAIADMDAGGGQILEKFAKAPHSSQLRSAAIQSLARLETQVAAREAAELLSDPDVESSIATPTMAAFLDRAGGADLLASALQRRSLTSETAQACCCHLCLRRDVPVRCCSPR